MRKASLVVCISFLLVILTVCGESSGVSFQYKIKPEYSKVFTSEDVAILIDYVRAAKEFQDTAFNTTDETEVEKNNFAQMGIDIVAYFKQYPKGDIRYDLSRDLLDYVGHSTFLTLAKAKYRKAKIDEDMGVESEYKNFLDKDKLFSDKEETMKSLLVLKKYIN